MTTLGKPGRPEKYPWALWTDGNTHHATQGVDFEQSAGDFRAQLHAKAQDLKRKGVAGKFITKVRDDVVSFRFVRENSGQ